MHDLERLSELIRQRNRVANNIASLIGRPAEIGHVGEFIASRVFDIRLEESASRAALDGYFVSGPCAGRSVDIKWYAKREGLLDITQGTLPDYYLVLTGPAATALSSRGASRPWVIDFVYLFDGPELAAELSGRGVKIGVTSSVRQALWEEAEIYPKPRNPRLVLSAPQRSLLALFATPI